MILTTWHKYGIAIVVNNNVNHTEIYILAIAAATVRARADELRFTSKSGILCTI